MEFKIQKKDFLRGLAPTLSVSEKRNTMPSLNHALLEAKDGMLQISATDLEIFMSSSVPCKTLSTGRIAVPARNLFDIVRDCDDDASIHIKTTDGNRLELSSGKSQFKLLGLSSDLFPHFKASPRGQLSTAKLNTREFIKLLQKTEHCICTDEIRYFLTGIFLESVQDGKEGALRAVATDGHRLAMYDIPTSRIGSLELKKGMILPRKGVAELRKLLEGSTEESFEVTCDENLFRTNIGDYQLWIRPIDGEYPDIRRVMPGNLPSKMMVSRKDLSSSLRKMSHLVSDRSRVVTFEFKKDLIFLSTTNPDLGEATDEVSAKYDGAELKTGYNVRFFQDAISNLDGETIEIGLGEKLQPALLKCAENPGYLIVVMPMRI
ncbi:MAG: DNA polymerase III subunit beta [Bdellovibrionales bacterium]|nr:DNA polymerase III subunit beta [Bdellovibrionales bacterium]